MAVFLTYACSPKPAGTQVGFDFDKNKKKIFFSVSRLFVCLLTFTIDVGLDYFCICNFCLKYKHPITMFFLIHFISERALTYFVYKE